jgi:uncharacterized damage-inducible protein DinB
MVKDIQILMTRELRSLAEEINMYPNEEMIWQVLPGITNSAGNLTLHLCGNLNHFIGAVLGKTGYIRDRESEFSARSGSRAELIEQVKKTEEIINTVLPTLTENILSENYPQKVGGIDLPCGRFLMHLAVHLSYHLGQVGYLRRILTQKNNSSGAISLKVIKN